MGEMDLKKIIFFDLDNTLHSTKQQRILPNTVKLLEQLYKNPNIELGLATGRAKNNVGILSNYIHMFKYQIYINGALSYKDNVLKASNPISKEDVLNILESATENNVMTGFLSKEEEFILNPDVNLNVFDELKISKTRVFTKELLKKHDIYQVWVFSKVKEDCIKLIEKTNLSHFSWHQGGYDIVDNKTNKANAIKALLKDEPDYELIAVGDGQNDIDMIELADIGVAMDNSRFSELKEKADHVAPNIELDQLYDFFLSIKIFS